MAIILISYDTMQGRRYFPVKAKSIEAAESYYKRGRYTKRMPGDLGSGIRGMVLLTQAIKYPFSYFKFLKGVGLPSGHHVSHRPELTKLALERFGPNALQDPEPYISLARF